MAAGARTVAGLADPMGQLVDGGVRPNGLRVTRIRVPLGVVGVIYENRPNVTSDSAGLCLKAGNATMLRGSSSALRSNRAVVSCLRDAVSEGGPSRGRSGAGGADRPRVGGGFHATARGSRLPDPSWWSCRCSHRCARTRRFRLVIDGDGNCHVYVDQCRRPRYGPVRLSSTRRLQARGMQRGRVAARPPRRGRRVLTRGLRRRCPKSSWSETSARATLVDAGSRHRE